MPHWKRIAPGEWALVEINDDGEDLIAYATREGRLWGWGAWVEGALVGGVVGTLDAAMMMARRARDPVCWVAPVSDR